MHRSINKLSSAFSIFPIYGIVMNPGSPGSDPFHILANPLFDKDKIETGIMIVRDE